MSAAKLGKGVDVDVPKLIESRMLVQANSGGGKSWTVRRLAEQTYGKAQQIVIDHDGEYHTLREKFDYVLAGKDGDCPADIKSAALLARRLLELGVSAIVDIYELGRQRQLFVQRFLDALVNSPRDLWHPVIVIVDEAHAYAPEAGQCLSTSAVVDLMTLGRKRGFCGVLATQRISKLHKDAAAEANNKLIGRTSLDIDMKRAADELGFTSKDDRLSLRTLGEGEFYAFGPALSVEGVERFKVGDVQTTHLRAGQRAQKPPPPPAKIQKLLGELADLPHEAEEEARTVDELRGQIKALKGELRSKPEPKVETKTKTIEKAVIKAADLKRLEALGAKLVDVATGLKETATRVTNIKPQAAPKNLQANGVSKRATGDAHGTLPHAPRSIVHRPPVHRVRPPNDGASNGTNNLPVGEAAVLQAAIQYGTVEKKRLSVITGYKRSTRDAYISRLREKHFILEDGSKISPTEDGIAAMPDAAPLPTGKELRSWWAERLPGGERVIFELVVAMHPEPMAKPTIDEQTGFKRSTRDAYISRLVARGVLVDNRGQVAASESLFD